MKEYLKNDIVLKIKQVCSNVKVKNIKKVFKQIKV